MPPEVFGRFTLIDRIAVGGMAEVYFARASGAEGLDKYFALKRILPERMKDAEFVQMFKSEAMIALNLTQSNIAQIYEFGQENGQFYLAMEFIEGRDLREILTRCAAVQDGFTMEQSIFLISEVASGLEFAHRCIDKKTGKPLKIIHRDISPQNIMVTLDGEVKIIDFGIAKAESRLSTTRAGTIKGKISYMSPEQAQGLELDGRTDIFSAGIILWELLTGRRLFEADDDEMATINKIRECRIQDMRIYNPRIPEEVHRIAMRALTKDRNYRYASARDFHRDLLSCLHKINPNFTREDLASVMKRLFQKEIEEFRKRFSDVNAGPVITIGGAGVAVSETSKATASLDTDFDFSGGLAADNHSKSSVSLSPASPSEKLNPQRINIVATPKVKPLGTTEPKAEWNSQDLLASAEVKAHVARQKFFSEAETEAKKQLADMAARAQTKHDLFIMGVAALVFALAAAGIYFRSNISHLAENREALISSVIDNVKGKFSEHREMASVQLHEGDSTVNSSSKDAVLDHTKIALYAIPAGSMVELNGQPYGKAPATLLLPLNTHVTITVKHDGYASFKQDFTVTGPKAINVTLDKAQ